MLQGEIINPCSSPRSFPVVMIPKKGGECMFCVDFRSLNQRSIADRYPLPNIEDFLEDLQRWSHFTSLDLFSGYWQVPLDGNIKDISKFTSRSGTFRSQVMYFGLSNAPSTFQRMMYELLSDVPFARAYLGDVVVFSKSLSDHLDHLRIVLKKLSQA